MPQFRTMSEIVTRLVATGSTSGHWRTRRGVDLALLDRLRRQGGAPSNSQHNDKTNCGVNKGPSWECSLENDRVLTITRRECGLLV